MLFFFPFSSWNLSIYCLLDSRVSDEKFADHLSKTIFYVINYFCPGFPIGSDGKESACNVGDLDSIPGLGRSPGGRHSNSLQYSCLENPHEQRSLAGYSSWGHKVLDMTA